ncbi:hypothetical protein EJB05_23951, partial [Eragrostis curvula]
MVVVFLEHAQMMENCAWIDILDRSAVCNCWLKCLKSRGAFKHHPQPSTTQYFNPITALHVQMNTKRGVLVTTRYSKIIFEPDRPEAEAMRGFQTRLKNASHQARQLRRDRLKDMNVL